jgi:GT2 family glycosyltransferase
MTINTIILVADVFVDAVPQGGAEIVNDLLSKSLKEKGFEVLEVEACRLDTSFIEKHSDHLFIVAGIMSLPPDPDIYKTLLNTTYLVYEHDHKYVNDRNPAIFPNFKAPESQLRFVDLYENAEAVICQSSMHRDILSLNLPNCNKVISAGGSLWSEDFISFVELSLSRSTDRANKAAIIRSANEIKGQHKAEQYCLQNNLDYDLVSAPDPKSLFELLKQYEYFVFLPKTPETFSRIFMEAKLAGCKIITNSLVGAVNENYTYDNPHILLEEVKKARESIVNLFESYVPFLQESPAQQNISLNPKVSIITSVYDGAKFIDGFLEDITCQSIFDKCELILVDCNEGNSLYEKEVIEKYQKKYSNIHYYSLDKDPGVYGAWNYGIKKSQGEYITNANLDDRRSYQMIELCYKTALQNPDKDLVYPCFLVTHKPHETFYTTRTRQIFNTLPFTKQNMKYCPPGCMPLWKKSLHAKNGMFDEQYTSAGDLEFWLRCVKSGSEFIRLNAALGLYYFNPDGLSTSSKNHSRKTREETKVLNQYKETFA